MLTTPHTLAAFQTLDWFVLGGYFVMLAGSGWWLSLRKQEGTDDYFLARHGMPAWAVAFSIVATALSAATFLGGPQQAYAGDLTYLSANLGVIAAVILVAVFFVPAFYKHGVATVYELLERRIGPRTKIAASGVFMLGRVFASGARIFIAAIPAAMIVFGVNATTTHLLLAIDVLVVVGIAYTLAGGIRSVIWSDVIQLLVFVGAAATALFVLIHRIPAGFGEVVDVLQHPGGNTPSKLAVFKSGVDPQSPLGIDWTNSYTLITAMTGLLLLNIGAYGTDQDLAQRMLTCRSSMKGSMSAIASIAINIPVTLLFMVVGLGLYVFYQRPDLMGDAAPGYAPGGGEKVFATFILRELPPGVTGLAMAGLFAAGLSSLNSALNAMSSTFVSDFYKPACPGRDEKHYLAVGRLAVVGWGVVLGAFACICVYWQRAIGSTLIDFALMVMVFAYAGLVAVFLTAIFTRRGSELSAIAALVVGFVTVLTLNWQPWVGEDGAGKLTIAFPWQMLIATTLAFGVACSGRRSAALADDQPVKSAPADVAATPSVDPAYKAAS
ncbi:MAG: sodium:solute symporter [Phycisphaera sp.]|nr:sodium:solute symporter [Phycisphaera sp.]